MALVYTRLLCRRNVDFRHFRSLYTCSPLSSTVSKPLLSNAAYESHDEKNMRLKRPMSPHLTIYQVQLTTVLSITHRTTGMILASYAMFLGLGTLFIPGGIPCVIEIVDNLCLPLPVLFASKVLLGLPATYHTFNGIRHLAWDLGMFLSIKEVYSTGYVVSALAIISALALATM
ncbi:PREDICTED: succinate dehydrogenase cytochrome b560 subunit, mitochondrial-like [Wasmannia auropunctata]|uniref:succinate dehydrogenase cytochrome b560 subunit, mitochondrial-like n=1 Tax=Wasmannia auropunctata TaxID=64793 RepID=UPI0005EEB011|nr:PREDICTED: succinate dehydrogenase cytochrome b560 subunit, mitochondrial-like [Wasmannia auropunctata]